MAILFPGALDTNTEIKSTHANGETVQAGDDNNQGLAIKALEAKLGIDGSAVASSIDYKINHFAHGSLITVGANDHHTQLHASDHLTGGADPITFTATGVRLAGPDYVIFKSGSNYVALKVSNGTTPYTSANAASVINQAASVLAAGSGGCIDLEPLTTFNCTSGVTLGGGVVLRGTRLASEGGSISPIMVASANLGSGAAGTHPLIKLTGYGAAVVDVNTKVTSNATECIYSASDATAIRGGFHQGGTQHVIANDPGTARQRWFNLRCTGGGGSPSKVMELFSTDSIIYDVVCTGTAPGGNALKVNGNNNMMGLMHITGDSTNADSLWVEGDGNAFSSVKVDTCGSNATAMILVTGSHNTFAACSGENAADGLTKPVIAIKGAAWGNQFMGFEYAPAAGNGQATGLVRFLTSGGATPADLSAFKGTKIFFAASGLDGPISNRYPTATEPVWIEGYVNSGSASGYVNYYPNHS